MQPQIALTSIVTAAALDEFIFLKFSFELFHGTDYQWFVRCDQTSLQALSAYPNVICNKFVESVIERPDTESKEFVSIMGEKMIVMEEAWRSGNWTGVVYFDADIIITAPVIATIPGVKGDVVLTPNYYPETIKQLASAHGYYNGGFVFTRSRHFHEWWQHEYKSRPVGYSDQICLDDAHRKFSVGILSRRANVGFWRSAKIPEYEAIPADCDFLHVHLFQPLRTQRQW